MIHYRAAAPLTLADITLDVVRRLPGPADTLFCQDVAERAEFVGLTRPTYEHVYAALAALVTTGAVIPEDRAAGAFPAERVTPAPASKLPQSEGRVAVTIAGLPHLGTVRGVARSNVYTCPDGVAADATSVPVDAYPVTVGAPIRVKVTGGKRATLARAYPDPKPGERVLLSLINHDLLALFVATIEPAETQTPPPDVTRGGS